MAHELGFEVVVPLDCEIGDAQARAIVASSRPAGALPVTDDVAINVRTSVVVEPGRVYVIDLARVAETVPPATIARIFGLDA